MRPSPGPRLLKVCGATSRQHVETVADAGADCVGLWHGVSGGHAELSEQSLGTLAAAARDTERLEPVLVTLHSDPDTLADLMYRSGVRWLQLHAYQPPAVVRRLRCALPDAVLLKVLHLGAQGCPEQPLLAAYERAGTDLFLIDSMTGDGKIGSTGQAAAEAEVHDLVSRFEIPFLLAGGITARNRVSFDVIARHRRFRGIDVDAGARDSAGSLALSSIMDLVQAWETARHREKKR